MAEEKLTSGTRIGTDLYVKRENGMVLENSSVLSISKNEKIDVDITTGFAVLQVQDISQLPQMKLSIQSITVEDSDKPSVGFDTQDNVACFTLCNFHQKFKEYKGSAYSFMKKIGDLDGISIILEMIVTPVINNKNTLVLTLNIYSKI